MPPRHTPNLSSLWDTNDLDTSKVLIIREPSRQNTQEFTFAVQIEIYEESTLLNYHLLLYVGSVTQHTMSKHADAVIKKPSSKLWGPQHFWWWYTSFAVTCNLLPGLMFLIQAFAAESEQQSCSNSLQKLGKYLKAGPLNWDFLSLQHEHNFNLGTLWTRNTKHSNI